MAEFFIDRVKLDHLIQDLEDGVITAEDRAQLMDLMRTHPSVRQHYLQHVELVTLLHATAVSRAELGTIPISQDKVHNQRRKTSHVALYSSIAALFIISIVFIAFKVSRQFNTEEDGIVMLSSEDAAFALVNSDGEPRTSENIQIGDTISLDSGLVRLLFSSGVEAILEGPSKLEFISSSSVKMDGGMAWFKVPEAGHGFTVLTDRVDVVDLGTEFGVRFDDHDGFQVHVAKGKVRIDPLLSSMTTTELTNGQAMAFDAIGHGQPTDYSTTLFRKKFDQSIPYLHWSFDQLVDGKFAANGTMERAEQYQAKIRHLDERIDLGDSTQYQTKGQFGNALAIDGDGVFAETSFAGIGGNAPRTFAGWVRHHSTKPTAERSWGRNPYCAWGRHGGGHAWTVYLWKDETPQFVTSSSGSLRFNAVNQDDLTDWMHVASVYTGKSDREGYPEIRHYINGVLLQSQLKQRQRDNTRVDTDISSDKAMPVRFGTPVISVTRPSTLHADLDEFYLFRGVLTAEQIKQLMEDNRVDFPSQ